MLPDPYSPTSGIDGALTTFVYLNNGKTVERHMPGGTVAREVFDSAGRKISEELGADGTSAKTRHFDYSYYPGGACGEREYPGKLQKVTDPRGVQSVSTYDGFGRLAKVASSGTAGEQNQTTTYQYDRRNLVTQIDQFYDSSNTGPDTSVSCTYDGYGQKINETVAIGNSGRNTWTQTWDAAGRRASLASSLPAQGSGAGAFTYGYRADGLLSSETSAWHGFSYQYGNNGLLASRVNEWRTQSVTSRDQRGRITDVRNTVAGNVVLSGALVLRNDSRIGAYTETRSGAASETRDYIYNDRGQLLSEPFSGTSGPNAFNYQFDGDQDGTGPGVRTRAESNIQTSPVTTIVSNANSFLQVDSETWKLESGPADTVDWTYDAAGNVVSGTSALSGTQTLKWDSFGRLVSVQKRNAAGNGLNWSAVYDGFGRRLRTVEQPVSGGIAVGTSGSIDSFYDPQVEFLELGVAVNGARTWKIYGPDLSGGYGAQQGIGGLEAVANETSDPVVFVPVLNDIFGNVVATVSGGAAVWNPAKVGAYGLLPGSPASVFGTTGADLALCTVWRGKRIDSTGLYYLGARYYDPQGGRFISPDPLGHASSMSLYDYANGDPVNHLDPTGRCSTINLGDDGARQMGINTGYSKQFPTTDSLLSPSDRAWLAATSPLATVPHMTVTNNLTGDSYTSYPRTDLSLSNILNVAGNAINDTLNLIDRNGGTDVFGSVGVRGFLDSVALTPSLPALAGLASESAATESRMVTVLGSGRDVSAYAGKAGFNVLDMSTVPEAQWARTNAEWLNTALRRGDDVWLLTDPAKHTQLMQQLGKESYYLNLELPMLEEYNASVVPNFAH